jgi:hypothetical protein
MEKDRSRQSKGLVELRERIDALIPPNPDLSWLKRNLIHVGGVTHSRSAMKMLLASGVLLLPGRDYFDSMEKDSQDRFLADRRIPGECFGNALDALESGSMDELWFGYFHDSGRWWAHIWGKKNGVWDFNTHRGPGHQNAYFGTCLSLLQAYLYAPISR